MNITFRNYTTPSTTFTSAGNGGTINLLGSSQTLEGWLNAKVAEGEQARMESIEFDGLLCAGHASALLYSADLVLIYTDHSVIPADATAYMPTEDSLEELLKAIITDEFAYHLVQHFSGPPDIFGESSFPYWKVHLNLQIPVKWQEELGIGISDEHLEDAKNRSALLLVLRTSQSANALWVLRGTTTLRYKTTEVLQNFSSLLEGAL